MPRRILTIAMPWVRAEHMLRSEGQPGLDMPFAVVEQGSGALRLAGVNRPAAQAGLHAGQTLADARAICPGVLTRTFAPERFERFMCVLTRWMEMFSPLVGRDMRDALVLDATGCAHLFGGEAEMLVAVENALLDHCLSGRAAMADTKGAAWGMAHFGPGGVVPEGRARAALGPLPVAALRIPTEISEALHKVGLATIDPLVRMPRGALARRFGIEAMRRLDQSLGAEPEPIAPERPFSGFSARLTLPEPIGLTKDVMAGLDRLLEQVCRQMETAQMGARTLRLVARRVDGADQVAEISLARPGRDPMRLRELFDRKTDEMEAGWGIDALHLSVAVAEPLKPSQVTQAHRETEAARLADLLSRLGNRVGFDKVTRFLPAESHIPERAYTLAAAAHSTAESWSDADRPPRPVVLFRPEPLGQPAGHPPAQFEWRGRAYQTARTHGPERLAPEWWWDDPDWRSGPRDYWRVETKEGPRLWLFHTPAHPAWYAQGSFA